MKLIQGDCLEEMKNIQNKSVDMILCDLPYGTTACKWDTIISFDKLWEQYERIIKDNGAIVLTASQPFTSILIKSNIKYLKYCLVWDKKSASNPQLSKYQHLKIHEDIVIFGKGVIKYNPQGLIKVKPFSRQTKGFIEFFNLNSKDLGDFLSKKLTTNCGKLPFCLSDKRKELLKEMLVPCETDAENCHTIAIFDFIATQDKEFIRLLKEEFENNDWDNNTLDVEKNRNKIIDTLAGEDLK